MKTLKLTALFLTAAFIFSSCNTQLNNTAKGGIIGGTGGAGLGALIGGLIGDGKGAAIGAGVGAVVGTGAGVLIGNKMDKAAKQAEEIDVKVTLDSGITFPTNGTTLSENAKISLSRFINQLDPQFDLAICGHTDNTGSLEVNQRVSLQRAQSVANYLTAVGLAYSRLRSVKGYDYQYPVADNNTAAGRAQNRRVELYLLPSQAMINDAQKQADN